jgi:hypothetical protein
VLSCLVGDPIFCYRLDTTLDQILINIASDMLICPLPIKPSSLLLDMWLCLDDCWLVDSG